MWYKLSIAGSSSAPCQTPMEERRGEIAGTFREWREGGGKSYLNRV
jgi:hypothetical protein